VYDFEQLKFYKCTSERHDGDENSEHKDLPKSFGIVHIGGPCLEGTLYCRDRHKASKVGKGDNLYSSGKITKHNFTFVTNQQRNKREKKEPTSPFPSCVTV